MKFTTIITSVLLALVAGSAWSQQTLLLSQPDLSADKLAFVYAGDIWVANKDGSDPRRLTSGAAEEKSPSFSPDGSKIAFAANYEDNGDVYVIDVTGGQPQRLTWHPGDDLPTGWTADGQAVTVVSRRETDHGRSGQLYHASLSGGLAQKQMEARVYQGVYNGSDSLFAYISFRPAYNGLFGGTSGWRGYRGGSTPAVQIMDMNAQSVSAIPGPRSTNFNPMWLDGALYFLSDRDNETFNIFRFDAASGEVTKHSDETSWEVRSAGGHGSSIAFEAGGRLKMLEVSSGTVSDIPISIRPDLPQLRSQWKQAGDTVQFADLSPSGKRAIVTARGEVFTVPVEDGSTRNVSNSGTKHEYTALWSPDGDQIAYITESNGGQSLLVKDQNGAGDSRSYELGSFFYSLIAWGSGDDARIVFQDNHLSLYAMELADGSISQIATGVRRDQIEAAISPDGRWLAYTLEQANFHRDLMLHEFASGDTVAVSDGAADVAAPAFSHDGKYLFFAASTNSGPTQVGLNMTSQERPYRAGLYAVVLAADGKSPLLPGSGDENDETSDDDEEASGDEDDQEDGEEPIPETRIDIDGIQARVVALPVAERNYGNLGVGKDGNLLYVQYAQPGTSNEPPGENAADQNALQRFDFEEKESSTLVKGVNSFAISAAGSHIIIGKVDGSLAVAEITDELEPEALSLNDARVRVNPREEWAQIFDEAWRMEQEYFYDPNMHGLDWQAVYDQYQPLVEHVGRREDLTSLIVQMIAELRVGHNRTGGGDVHDEQGTNTGLLGANLTIANDRYQLARVYSGESWNPFVKAPLATPGNEARAGEYILAVNGAGLTSSDNIFERLQGTNGKQVTLRVGPQADGENARDIVIEPVASERLMRLWAWIENNRRLVSDATDGRVGYVYLPNTAGAGYTYFNRMFFAQIDKQAMIIDERSNAGGQAANYITDVLSRRHLSGWKDRDGQIFNTPAGALHGPKVMLIDQDAGSGGDFLPYSFRQLGIGKLIGTRTWGGLIGIFTNPLLMDGSVVTVPYFRFFDADHNWTVENQGVAPDIEIALDPIATNNGTDSQLDGAIAEILSQLEGFTNPIETEAPAMPTELGQ
jgi:tricorn protease